MAYTQEHRDKISRALKGKQNAKGSVRTQEFKDNLRKHWLENTHPTYKGSNANYSAKHHRIHKRYGKASKCENKECVGKSKVYEWANISGQFYNNKSDWFELCRSCHRIFDFSEEKRESLSKKAKTFWEKNPELKAVYARTAQKQAENRTRNANGTFA